MAMPRMLHLKVSGAWRDAWLYKGYLLLWSRAGTVHLLNTLELLDHIRDAYGQPTAVLSEYLLFRNDWKTSEQFRLLFDIPGIKQNMVKPLPLPGKSRLLTVESLSPTLLPIDAAPGTLLDTAIYANRLYAASTDGLFEGYFNPNSPQQSNSGDQTLEGRISAVSAKYLIVNASAEDEGLWCQSISLNGDVDVRPKRVAETSLTTSFSSRHLLNYTDSPAPQFLRSIAEKRRPHDQAAYEGWHIKGYEAPRDLEPLTRAALSSSSKVSLDDVSESSAANAERFRVLGNSNYRLLVSWKRRLSVIDVSAYDRRPIEARPDSVFTRLPSIGHPASHVLGTYAIGAGFLVELFDHVRLFTRDGACRFFDGAAARVRTFASSLRYKDVAVVVEEDGVRIIGFLQ